MGDGEIFAGLLPEVVATPSGICDKVEEKQQNRVAKAGCGAKKSGPCGSLFFVCESECVDYSITRRVLVPM